MLQTAPDDPLLTKTEVLELIHMSPRTLQRRRWDGTIKALRVNNRFFFYPKSGIDEFIAKLKSGELQTVTFDKVDQPRQKQPPRKSRSRGSRRRAKEQVK